MLADIDPQVPTLEELYARTYPSIYELIPKQTHKILLNLMISKLDMYVEYILNNPSILKQTIDLGLATHTFESPYNKRLSNFCMDVLLSDNERISELFMKSPTAKHEDEEIRPDGSAPVLGLQQFNNNYEHMAYLLKYIHLPKHQINENCITYLSKLLANLAEKRSQQFYLYFHDQPHYLASLYPEETQPLPSLDLLIKFTYQFPALSEMLAKIIGQEGPANKYLHIKQKIVDGMLRHLTCEEKITKNVENFSNVLDFVSYVFMKNKYKSDDEDKLIQISQRFVDEGTLWYFKEKLINSVIEVARHAANSCISLSRPNSLFRECNLSSSTELTKNQQTETVSQEKVQRTVKRSFTQSEAERVASTRQYQQLVVSSQLIFENALNYLLLVAERLNSEQQPDPYNQFKMSDISEKKEPTMDFQVDEIFFSENSLFELATLSIPLQFQNTTRVKFYDFLLMLMKNSRLHEEKEEMGLREGTLINVLVHLLKAFRKQFWLKTNMFKKKKLPVQKRSKNAMVKLKILQMITHYILPKIQTLEPKEAMMVLSAANPQFAAFNQDLNEEDRALVFQLFVVLQNKCDWFPSHFKSSNFDTTEMKIQFNRNICGSLGQVKNRTFKVKQFQFMKSAIISPQLLDQEDVFGCDAGNLSPQGEHSSVIDWVTTTSDIINQQQPEPESTKQNEAYEDPQDKQDRDESNLLVDSTEKEKEDKGEPEEEPAEAGSQPSQLLDYL